MRILLSAYACAPDRGSEPGVGWNWARILSDRHEVHVLTAAWSAPLIRQELHRRPRTNLHFHFVPDLLPDSSRWPLGLGWLHQYVWQLRAYLRARELHARFCFDLAHHVSYSSWRVPSLLVRLGIPFVFGPVGGGHRVPPGFLGELGLAGMLRESVRLLSQRLQLLEPLVGQTLRSASVVLAANTDTLQFLRPLRSDGIVLMLETGIWPPAGEWADPGSDLPRPGADLRVLWVGQMVATKALPLLLRALVRLDSGVRVHLDVVGDGPRRSTWEQMARDLGLAQKVSFLGRLSFDSTQALYRQADVLVFTSLRETSGNVILEAMLAGLPVVCLDWSGPHDLTCDRCAIRICPRSPGQVVEDIAEALRVLAGDAERRRRMGQAGRARALNLFSWERKRSQIEQVYAQALRSASHALPLAAGGCP